MTRAPALPPLGFGAAPIGNLFRAVSDEDAIGAVEAAWAAGIRYFDTAPYYGLGLAETRLGDALARHAGEPHLVSTKVGKRLVEAGSHRSAGLVDGHWALDRAGEWVHDYSRDGILATLEGSMRRLRRDRIDFVYIHDPEAHLDQVERETAPALAALRDEGVISGFGVGTSSSATARRLGESTELDVIMIAGRWTLLDRDASALLDWATGEGLPIVAAAPFNSGLLARAWPPDDARFEYSSAEPRMLALARELARACVRHGAALPEAALQFPARHPAVTSVVVGMASEAEVVAAIAAAAAHLSPELWEELEGIVR